MPWAIDIKAVTPEMREMSPLMAAFKGVSPNDRPVEYDELMKEFCNLTGWPYPIEEMAFASSWTFFRVRVVRLLHFYGILRL